MKTLLTNKMYDLYDLGKGKTANEDQKKALDLMASFVDSDIEEFTLIGEAGTGKTTIIKKIIAYYQAVNPRRSVVTATISHAAKNVLYNAIGDYSIPTVTVAKLLGMKQTITKKGEIKFEPNPKTWRVAPPPIKNCHFIVVDECSMISSNLLSLIREHKLPGAKIIFMGDWHQLPPIDENRELDEDSPTFDIPNQAVLIEKMRQKKDSPIITIAEVFARNIDSFNETGNLDREPLKASNRVNVYDEEKDAGIVFTNSFAKLLKYAVEDFRDGLSLNDPNFTKAIAFRNKNPYGIATYNIGSLNATFRHALWKTQEQFVEGELIVANNQFVMGKELLLHNGDSLLVKNIRHQEYKGVKCCVLDLINAEGIPVYGIPVVSKEGFEGYNRILKTKMVAAKANYTLWKDFYDFKDQFADINYGYAITAHKAQGSGYRNVYVFEEDIMEVKTTSYKEKFQCMYTAITRATDKVIMFKE